MLPDSFGSGEGGWLCAFGVVGYVLLGVVMLWSTWCLGIGCWNQLFPFVVSWLWRAVFLILVCLDWKFVEEAADIYSALVLQMCTTRTTTVQYMYYMLPRIVVGKLNL
jgi:hypothetical protein